VNAMLLNEFIKEHKKVEVQRSKIEKQEATIAELKSTVAEEQRQIVALAAGLQKVSDRLQTSSPPTQVAER